MLSVGSRRQVWNRTAKRTSGGLERKDLIKNKYDRIVSAKKHKTAKKERRLEKAGYGTRKGKFGWVKIEKKAMHKKPAHKSRKHKSRKH